RISSQQEVFRGVVYVYIRRHAVVFQVVALYVVEAGPGRANGGAIQQTIRASADYGAIGGLAHHLAQAESAEAVREYFRIAGGAFILHDHHGAEESRLRTGNGHRVAPASVLVLALAE